MNAITGIENLIAQPAILQTPFWCAYNDKIEDKNRIRDNYGTQNASIEDAEKGLRTLVNDLSQSGCNLCIWFSEAPKPAKGGYRINFYMPAQSPGYAQPIAGTQAPAINVDELVSEKVKQALADYQREQELRALKERIRNLEGDLKESQKETALDRIVGRLEPFADVLIDHYLPDMNTQQAASTAIAGNANDDQAQQIAEQALAVLADGEPELHLILKKLADLKQNSPAKYAMAKSML